MARCAAVDGGVVAAVVSGGGGARSLMAIVAGTRAEDTNWRPIAALDDVLADAAPVRSWG